jgi:putative ABC transport system permease protein
MIRSFFKIAWRNLFRNKVYSLINILGLATGMAVALIIGLWVYHQYSYDRFWPEYERVYQAWNRYDENGQVDAGVATALPLADELKRSFPEIEYVAQSDWMGSHSLVIGEKKISASGGMVGQDFLKIFQLPFINGNANAALSDPYSIVLCQSIATALFGKQDPIGKTVRIDNSNDLRVTAVVEDLPKNSSLRFKFLVPFDYLKQYDHVRRNLNSWRDKSFQCFVTLKPGVQLSSLEPRLKEMQKKLNPEDYKLWKIETMLHPMKDWHLYNNYKLEGFTGFISYVKMFSLIGALVLLIACINFMNLSTARSEKRAKEVGIRKAIGSLRTSLIFQFLTESILITLFAFFVSLLMVQLALPAFNGLIKASLGIPWQNGYFWMGMTGYVLLTGLMAGLRPAFYLSSFRPVKVLKGPVSSGPAAAIPRKILVVLQFTCSVALIISTVIIYQQIQHAKDRPIGYESNRLMMTYTSSDLFKNYRVVKNEMLQSGVVSSVTMSSSPVTDIWSNQRVDDWSGKRPDESLTLQTVAVSDADYFKTVGMKLVRGRNFTGNNAADSLDVILNESAVKRMGFKEPINQILTWHDTPQKIRVIGVVQDALMKSPFSPPEPSIFIFDPQWASVITYRLSPNVSTQTAIQKIGKIVDLYNPSSTYSYQFVDENYKAKFHQEVLIGKLSGIFALLAILISCLGLFGLAAYITEQRTREIGIRKVLGASVSQLWLLLCREFIILVIIGCVIASPIAYYFSNEWLQQYQYRISIGPLVFVLSAVIALLITLFTVSFKAIRASLSNPVRSLRTE